MAVMSLGNLLLAGLTAAELTPFGEIRFRRYMELRRGWRFSFWLVMERISRYRRAAAGSPCYGDRCGLRNEHHC